jgi:hypothetical protein
LSKHVFPKGRHAAGAKAQIGATEVQIRSLRTVAGWRISGGQRRMISTRRKRHAGFSRSDVVERGAASIVSSSDETDVERDAEMPRCQMLAILTAMLEWLPACAEGGARAFFISSFVFVEFGGASSCWRSVIRMPRTANGAAAYAVWLELWFARNLTRLPSILAMVGHVIREDGKDAVEAVSVAQPL